MGYSEDRDRERIADSWRIRTQGPNAHTSTIGGKMEADAKRADLPQPVSAKPSFPSASGHASYPNNSYPKGPQAVAGRSQGAPLFPFVDRAFNKIPRTWYWVLLFVGALCGFAHASSSGVAGGAAMGEVLIGAFAGLLLIPLLRLGVKIVLGALAVGLVGMVLYFIYQAAK